MVRTMLKALLFAKLFTRAHDGMHQCLIFHTAHTLLLLLLLLCTVPDQPGTHVQTKPSAMHMHACSQKLPVAWVVNIGSAMSSSAWDGAH
eukprot:1160434-Pelagomonas_calceolata.AAC.2